MFTGHQGNLKSFKPQWTLSKIKVGFRSLTFKEKKEKEKSELKTMYFKKRKDINLNVTRIVLNQFRQ